MYSGTTWQTPAQTLHPSEHDKQWALTSPLHNLSTTYFKPRTKKVHTGRPIDQCRREGSWVVNLLFGVVNPYERRVGE